MSINITDDCFVIVEKILKEIQRMEQQSTEDYRIYFSEVDDDDDFTRYEQKAKALEVGVITNSEPASKALLSLVRTLIDCKEEVSDGLAESFCDLDLDYEDETGIKTDEIPISDAVRLYHCSLVNVEKSFDLGSIKLHKVDIYTSERIMSEMIGHSTR